MTINASAAAGGCHPSGVPRARSIAAFLLLSLLAVLAFAAAGAAHAQTYVGIGYAHFEGPGSIDESGHGLDLRVGRVVRNGLAIEVGALQQRGDIDFSLFDSPTNPLPGGGEVADYGWRALHAGARLFAPVHERWEISAGLALAHVSLEREGLQVTPDPQNPDAYVLSRGSTYRDSTLGALATLGVAFELSPQHRLNLDYRRLHAGLDERCDGSGLHCRNTAYKSVDGLTLAWSYRFR